MTTSFKTLPTAWLFPGQGSQAVGMGCDLLQAYPDVLTPLATQAERLCAEAGAPNLLAVLAEGPAETLQETRYTQPALLLVSLMMVRLLAHQAPELRPAVVAGHSLGELAALVAANVITEADALALVAERSRLMQQAPAGAMAAVLGLTASQVNEALSQAGVGNTATDANLCVIANDNASQQIVITGTAVGLEQATPALKAAGAKRVVPLPVGGAFHSPLMGEANAVFAQAIDAVTFSPATCDVISNVTGQASRCPDTLKANLKAQMTGSVQWVATQHALEQAGITQALELGAGAVLAGLAKKTTPSLSVTSVGSVDAWQTCLASLTPAPCAVGV
jgi:[acyl-carrier-protein] S-malonyltransferase